MDDRIHWTPPPERPNLTNGCVHVWQADLDLLAEALADFRVTLSAAELNRANRFKFERDRSRFVVARGILRGHLSNYMNCPSSEIEIQTNAFGKPFVAGDINFNLSHSSSLALFAFVRNCDIGIDVEQIRSGVEYLEIARQHFDEQALRSLQESATERQLENFFWEWTSKEALVKAAGKGLAAAAGPEIDRLTQNTSHVDRTPKWRLYKFVPRDNFVAAIVSGVNAPEFRWWHFSGKENAADQLL